MAYDRDGSAIFGYDGHGDSQQWGDGTSFTGYSTSGVTTMTYGNDENLGTSLVNWTRGQGDVLWGLVFPEHRDLVGYYVACSGGASSFGAVEYSSDTTTGIDGVWSTLAGFSPSVNDTSDGYRSHIVSAVASGIKGVRFHGNTGGIFATTGFSVLSMHLYGAPSSGENPDSLRPWHPTLDQQADGSTLDFGDMPRGASATLTFRVKNVSPTKTANATSVAMETLTNASPSLLGQFQLSADNLSFSSTLNLGTLAPGAISPLIYVRDALDPAASLSVWDVRIVATAGSWT